MSTYTQILYQIVFSTRNRENTLSKPNRDRLFKIIWTLLEKNKCHPYRINGVSDHLHIVTHLHPTVALSDLVKNIKLGTTDAIKEHKLFPMFNTWQDGYGAFTYTIKEKDRLIEYVKNQESHHAKISFEDEYKQLLKEHDIEFRDEYLF